MIKKKWRLPIAALGPFLLVVFTIIFTLVVMGAWGHDEGTALTAWFLYVPVMGVWLMAIEVAFLVSLILRRKTLQTPLQAWFYRLYLFLIVGYHLVLFAVFYNLFQSTMANSSDWLYELTLLGILAGFIILLPIVAFFVVNSMTWSRQSMNLLKSIALVATGLSIVTPPALAYYYRQKTQDQVKHELIAFYHRKGYRYKVKRVHLKGDRVYFDLEDYGVSLPVQGEVRDGHLSSVNFVSPDEGMVTLLTKITDTDREQKRLDNFYQAALDAGYKAPEPLSSSESKEPVYALRLHYGKKTIKDEGETKWMPKRIQNLAAKNRASKNPKRRAFNGYAAIRTEDYLETGMLSQRIDVAPSDEQEGLLEAIDFSGLEDGYYSIGEKNAEVKNGKIISQYLAENDDYKQIEVTPMAKYEDYGNYEDFYVDR